MEDYGRNSGTFWGNRLNSTEISPEVRFCDLERSELTSRLDRLADVRSSVVARGRVLIANPIYPGKRIIRQISLLLAERL